MPSPTPSTRTGKPPVLCLLETVSAEMVVLRCVELVQILMDVVLLNW